MTSRIGLNVNVSGAASSAAQLGRVGDAASKSGERWRKMGDLAKKGGLAVAAGAAAAAAGLYDAGQAAGDLGETLSKTTAIFGDQGGAALAKWAKGAEVSLGQSQQTALDAAATFGTFGKAAGLAGGDLVKFAQNNAQLATDMASFSNTSPEEAIEAIGAAFRGEAEPMRSYGVLLDDTTLRNTALRLGLVKTTKEALTPQQKVLAAQAAILKQTKDAQGDFAKTSGGLAGQQKILSAQLQNVKVRIGQGVLPAMTSATSYFSSKAIPTAERLWRAYERNGIDGLVGKIERLTDTQGKLSPIIDETVLAGQSLWRIVKDLAPAFADAATALPPFLSPLQIVGDVLETVADVVEGIPDGFKSFAVQAGLAALVLPRLAAGATATGVAFGRAQVAAVGYYQALRFGAQYSQQAAMAAGRLKSAAASAAGIGGLLLLTHGMGETDKASRTMMTAAGGAAAGFAVGGPWGAAIGGAVGALAGLTGGSDQAAEAQARLAEAQKRVTSTLNEQTGAFTKKTRQDLATALADQGLLAQAQKDFGMTEAQIAQMSGAILNSSAAIEQFRGSMMRSLPEGQLQPFIEEFIPKLRELNATYGQGANSLLLNKAAMGETAGAALRLRVRIQEVAQQLNILPRQARILIQATNAGKSTSEIRRLGEQMKLTPRQVTTSIKVLEADRAKRDARQISQTIREIGKLPPDFRQARRSFSSFYMDANGIVERGGRDTSRKIEGGTKNAKPDLTNYRSSLRAQMATAKSEGGAGASGIGTEMKSGLYRGFAGADGMLSGQVRGAVRAAIAAGRSEAGIRSPSKKTEYLGAMMAKGAEAGMRKGTPGTTRAGVDLIRDLVKGIGKEAVKAERVLNAVTRNVERSTDKVRRMKDLRASYVADFQGFSSSVFGAQAPTLEDGSTGPQTIDGLLSFAAGQAAQAEQVQAAVKRLTGPGGLGLSPDLIKQLRAQGAGGIEQILALAGGSSGQIKLLNSLNKQTNGAYAATGLGLFATQGGAADLADAQRDRRQAKALAAEVDRLITKRMDQHLERVVFEIRGDKLIAVIRKTEREKAK